MPACVSSGQQTLALGAQQERKAGCLGFSGPQPGRQDSGGQMCGIRRDSVCREAGWPVLCCKRPFWGPRFPHLSVDAMPPGLPLLWQRRL